MKIPWAALRVFTDGQIRRTYKRHFGTFPRECSIKYRVFTLMFPRAWQIYRVTSLHPLGTCRDSCRAQGQCLNYTRIATALFHTFTFFTYLVVT
jgi:hypothetical protein